MPIFNHERRYPDVTLSEEKGLPMSSLEDSSPLRLAQNDRVEAQGLKVSEGERRTL